MTSLRIICTDLAGILTRLCKQYDISSPAVYEKAPLILDSLGSMELPDIRLRFQGLFTEVISQIPRGLPESLSPHVREAVEYIRKNYKKGISLQSAADSVDIRNTYLSTLFKNELGIDFAEYLNDFRLEKSKQLFETGNRNIRDVAENCGFGNYYGFFKVFKKKYGITPKEYIRQLDSAN